MFNKVLFGIVTIILVVVIYITSLLGIIYERQAILLEQLIDESIEERDFTKYIKYSSLYYNELNPTTISDTDDYLVTYFRTVETNRSGETISQLIVFVMANEPVQTSETEKNETDQTRMEIWSNGTKVYSTKDDDIYKNFAISWGLREQDFYYYNYLIEGTDFDVKLFDYQGFLIEIATINTPAVDLSDEDAIRDAGFLTSYTVDEIEVMLEIKDHVWKIYMYIGIFMVIDIAFAFFIFRKKSV
jgi:hypothetical protein